MVKILMHILLVIILASFAEGILAKQSSLLHADAWRSTMENTPCHFGLADPFNGQLNNSSGSKNQWQAYYATDLKKNQRNKELGINFACSKESSFERSCIEYAGVEFNGRKWVYNENTEQQNDINQKRTSLSRRILLPLDKAGVRGALSINSDTTGPIRYRSRSLGFCMTSGNGWTLWGGGIVDYPPYSPRKSTEAEAIRLIKSIRFISPPASAASPSSAPR